MAKTTFEQWMKSVDAILVNSIGISSADLPDCCYLDWYDDGISAKSAARRAVRAME